MLSMSLTRVFRFYNVCDKVVVRNLRARTRLITSPNPGLDRRIKSFKQDGVKIDDEDAEEFVEESASDFFATGEKYNTFMKESLAGKHDLKHKIIKNKYFNETLPNLLTWSEKEQIRHLYNNHPDEWTLERLAESFPVTVPVIKKLTKYPWKPATEERIARHDANAMRNWRELKEGTLNIPEELRQHFLKFSNRTIPPLNKQSIKIDFEKVKEMGEFQRIIEKCARKESEQDNISQITTDTNESPKEATKPTKGSNKPVTLNELASKIKTRLESGENVNLPDQIIVDSVQASPIELGNQHYNDVKLYEEDNKNMVTYKAEDKAIDVTVYPERIRIPKSSYKKEATYKVNDCFYDHDGRFLYRVIGMNK